MSVCIVVLFLLSGLVVHRCSSDKVSGVESVVCCWRPSNVVMNERWCSPVQRFDLITAADHAGQAGASCHTLHCSEYISE